MSNVPILGEKKMDNEPMFRLLYCLVCDSLDELPPYDGVPEQDHLLTIACESHIFPSGEPHKGKLFVLPLRAWAKPESRKEIIKPAIFILDAHFVVIVKQCANKCLKKAAQFFQIGSDLLLLCVPGNN